jgi:tetratricopeptide (TPR) repeat protein
VYQRIGRLALARADAERSQKLGEDIRWDRNTAFCLKCIGRLYRLEAEAATSVRMRADLFSSSISYLHEAIHLFPKVTELSEAKRREEVGDCYSLLARTFLIAGNRREAEEMAKMAIERIPEGLSKDYADLQVVLGDLRAASNEVADAVSFYDSAIEVAGSTDAERSEIAARAWFAKGMVTRSMASFAKASTIWKALEEDGRAAEAEWEIIRLEKKVHAEAMELLQKESAAIRVEAIRLHNERLASLARGFRGRRSTPDERYWIDRISEAKSNVAVRHREW